MYPTAVSRIRKIQSQLANPSPGIRLKDKVCVITGVGSMTGIGYACLWNLSRLCVFIRPLGVHLPFVLPTKVHEQDCHAPSGSLTNAKGAKHLYVIDYAAENLPNLKSTIETKYPNVKVSANLFLLRISVHL